jgi:signal transduction histidine kinase
VALLYLENELAPGVFTPDRLVGLELIAAQVAISLENALLLEREHEGRVEAEAASRRALILGEATALVSSTFDYKDVFRSLTRLCVRELCDWAAIDIVDQDHIVRIASAHRDPVKEVLMGELTERYTPRFGVPSLAMRVIEGGAPTHLPDVGPEQVRPLCLDDHHFDIIQKLGARSGLGVPLVAREALFGALSLVSATPNRFVEADVELVVEIGRRTALAIDNARLLVETQRAVHLRDQFLSTASHELRTPVTSLKLIVESLVRGAGARPLTPAAYAGRLQRVERSTNRLEHLVNELLDVTRIEQGQAILSPAEMDLGALVREVVQHFELDLARAGCSVSVEATSPAVGSVVGYWDASRLEQVVTNLLGNAIKFGTGRPIEVTVRDAGQAVELQMRDHGIGIAADRLPKVFDRFERAVSTTHYGGLGLGLYLARSIVESHGGAITVESRLDEGSTFTVRLPRTLPRQTP